MRILIATVIAGAGRPDDVVDRVDLIKFFSPSLRRTK
jgi:hypothetical protein